MDMRRITDFAVSGIALTASSPVIIMAGAVVYLTMGGPILFKQKRYGLNGKVFTMYKIRSMTNARGSDGQLLPDEERMTRVGKFLRSMGLDELPQLVNILKGDMTFIGPRPQYYEDDIPEFRNRYAVKPGVTGLAKVREKLNHENSPEAELANDLAYIATQNLRLDLKILFQTAVIIFSGRTDPPDPVSNLSSRKLLEARIGN